MRLPLWLRSLLVRGGAIPPTSGGSIKLPTYAIVGLRPVKAERTADGGMQVLAYDWKTGEFVPDGSYLPHLFMPSMLEDDAGGDIDYVSKGEFERRVNELRSKTG